MNLLTVLHNQGATICMVTHDPRYAELAGRTVHLFDGRILDEQTSAELHRTVQVLLQIPEGP